MNKLTLAAIGLASVSAQASVDYDYRNNGATWGDDFPNCAANQPNRSPIDLVSPKEVMRTQAYPIIGSQQDKILKDYNNVRGQEIRWDGYTSSMQVAGTGVYNRFQKRIAGEYNTPSYYAGPMEFNAERFHFRSGSEHTVDGYRYDLEMQTVHTAKADAEDKDGNPIPLVMDGIGHSIVAVLFDVKYYTAKLSWAEQKVVDNFFDSMKWDDVTGTPIVDIVNYGVLMTMFDFNNRYTYRGSATTPPCDAQVHWNVLSTIYPISQKHLDLFKSQLARNTVQQPPLTVTGNFRVTMPINGHNVMYIKSETPTQASEFYAMDTSGELYLLEGADDQKWLDDLEATKFRLEETAPGQYHYVAKEDPKDNKDTSNDPIVTLPTFSITAATKAFASLAAAASVIMNSM